MIPNSSRLTHRIFSWHRLLDALLILFLIVAAVRVGQGLERFKDLEMPDESNYLHLGRHFFSVLRPPADNSPLYSYWYNQLSRLRRDPIDLFYLNARLTAALPALLIFLLLRARRMSPEAAAMAAFLFLISPANVGVWPRVSHFALCLLLAGFAIESRIASPARKALALALAALLASYCSPEFYLAFLGLLGVWLFSLIRHRRVLSWRRELAALAAFALLAGGLHAWLGRPMFGGEGRSFFAFGQHYSLNWVERHHSPLSPWTDWQAIMAREFGPGVDSVGGALRARPGLFLTHLGDNAAHFLRFFKPIFKRLLLPFKPSTVSLAWPFGLAAALGCGYLFFAFRLRGIAPRPALAALRRWIDLDAFLRLAAIMAPGLLSCLIIYPRSHYVFLLAAALFLVLADLGARLAGCRPDAAPPAPWIPPLAAACVAAVVFTLTPTAGNYSRDSMDRVRNIRFIRTLNIQENPVGFLDGDLAGQVYLPGNYRLVFFFQKTTFFDDFAKQNHLGVIKTDPEILNHPHYVNDPQWRELLSNPAGRGFVSIPLPAGGKTLLVRGDLLDNVWTGK